MKKYIQPAMAIYNVNIQSVLESASLEVSQDEVNGNQALSKRHRNAHNEWDDEMWDEENGDETQPTF